MFTLFTIYVIVNASLDGNFAVAVVFSVLLSIMAALATYTIDEAIDSLNALSKARGES
jgi:hypothetical protein